MFIFQTDVPGQLEADQRAAAGPAGVILPRDFAFRTMDFPVTKRTKGGEVRIVDSSAFKVSTTVAMAMVTVRPGGLRELHWHPNADEWQYYISGQGRMTVVATGNRARTLDFQAGDVGYVEKTLLHYIENTGDTDLVFLEMFTTAATIRTCRFRSGWRTRRLNWSWRICALIRRRLTRFRRIRRSSCPASRQFCGNAE